jgi:hypothetical protein
MAACKPIPLSSKNDHGPVDSSKSCLSNAIVDLLKIKITYCQVMAIKANRVKILALFWPSWEIVNIFHMPKNIFDTGG